MKFSFWPPLLLIIAGAFLPGAAAEPRDLAADNRTAFGVVSRMRVGVNLGNALEAPSEGAWGMTLEADYFRLIREAGLQTIRVPVRWTAHADAKAPYRISPDFFKRIDWVLEQAKANQLYVVLNVHHFEEIMADPAANRQRLMAIWEQISQRYADYPNWLVFELLNEPRDKITAELWNDYVAEALTIIRKTNPERLVVVGPANWNNFASLPKLKLPENDRLLVVTFHYYNPFNFTHQGAAWVKDSNQWLGKTWRATPDELAILRKDFDLIANWGRSNRRPLYLGEFGLHEKVDSLSRQCWIRTVREEALARGMAATYWEFAAAFGLYDLKAKAWKQPLLDALVGKKIKKEELRVKK